MEYKFLKFVIDTNTKELFYKNERIEITNQLYELLMFFVKDSSTVFAKEEIIDQVWKGRYVTENSLDQSISKLRKLLSGFHKSEIIKTVYGKGLKFLPEVKMTEFSVASKTSFNKLFLIVPAIVLLLGGLLFYSKISKKEKSSDSLLLILSSSEAIEENKWLNDASQTIVNQLMRFSNSSKLKAIKSKPEYQNRQQFIDTQWQVSPDLKVITTHLHQLNNNYILDFNIADKYNKSLNQTFTNENLSTVFKNASQWLANEMKVKQSSDAIDPLLPNESYLIELYMHGLSEHNSGNIDKALNYFELCIKENPDFDLARLKLAEVLSNQGKQKKALAMLATLAKSKIYPQIEIEVENVRADIFDTQGKYEKARDIFVGVLSKYQDTNNHQLNSVRLNLSHTYATLIQYDKALIELDAVANNVAEDEFPELLAHMHQKKASILQKLGHTSEAIKEANKSLTLYVKLNDMLSEAKLYITLARINNHLANYDESVSYLEKSLAINQKLGYKLGSGAAINELVYVLMVQGQFNKALQLNQQMERIAIDIDYNAMLQISKQYSVDINRVLGKFSKAEIYLKDHLQMAKSANNPRALLKNKLLAIDLYLEKKQLNPIEPLIQAVQSHIDKTGELRLQPRINRQLARLYLFKGDFDKATFLLNAAKEQAQKTSDGETLTEINNILAEHYLSVGNNTKVLQVLEQSVLFNPLPYPYLLLKSKANHALGNIKLSLDLANECKLNAYDWWSLEDDVYLQNISKN